MFPCEARARPIARPSAHEMVVPGPPSYDVLMPWPGGQLEDKVVLVSGGASDIGRATALRLAGGGAAVAIGDVSIDGAAAVAESVERAGGRAIGVQCDVRQEESVAAFVAQAVAAFGAVHAIDHNAAWSHPRLDTDAVGVDLGVWDRVIEITTRGALLLARHAIPVMAEGGGGSIVMISSGTSTIGESTRVAYGAAKAALNQLTRHLAVRYGREGIRANAIAPGFILTETASNLVPEDVQTRLAEANPMRRLGTPDDIARVVAFLCSDDAAYVNGQILHVDGGHQIAGMM
jgi:NAD(P)-dependent dehydrogenase (short-subunit alcohol dehydrogenase family)